MVHEIKNINKQLPLLGIIIKSGMLLLGFVVVLGLIRAFGASVSTVVAVYLGYKVLRLVMRLLGLVTVAIFTLFSIFILLLIITLLLF